MAACSLLVPPHGAAIPRELLLEAACSSLALSMPPFSCPRRAPQLAKLAKLQHQLATSCQQLLGVKLSAQTPWKQSPESCRQGRKEALSCRRSKRAKGLVKEAEQVQGTLSVAALPFFALRLDFYTSQIAQPHFIGHFLSSFLCLARPVDLWYPCLGCSLPSIPTGLPVPTSTSRAISFHWRLAATHHL